MGVTAVLALLMTILAYLAQSPRALVRLGLAGQRLDLRVKLFTGYALASLILMLGFFLAGVPLDNGGTTAAAAPTTEIANIQPTSADTGAMGDLPSTAVVSENSQSTDTETIGANTTQTPASGAFGGPPPGSSNEVATEEIPPSATPEQAGPSATPGGDEAGTAVPTPINSEASTATATASPTATNTPLPTATPTPTITPTPIEGSTGTINTDGSTLWVRRSPGGQNLVIVQDNEIVLIENGRANQGGILWREVRTVNGVLGWVQAEFLNEG